MSFVHIICSNDQNCRGSAPIASAVRSVSCACFTDGDDHNFFDHGRLFHADRLFDRNFVSNVFIDILRWQDQTPRAAAFDAYFQFSRSRALHVTVPS